MKFKHKLYDYQKNVLKIFEKEIARGDKKIHVVAPPGSGKTIMGLEMISRIGGNHLILVPNLTLQYQWRDKIEQFFLEEGEKINDIVSININEIKKVNILTYQSLTTSNRNNDLILDKILDKWHIELKNEFKSKADFLEYIEILKDIDIDKYKETISKYKKKLKTGNQDLVEKILSKKVLNYFNELKKNNIESIVVDEAHHLTSWWSKVIYYLWEGLGNDESNNFNYNYKSTNNSESIISYALKLTNKNKYSTIVNFPLIIGLTATPPYDDIDFFTLDDDYSKLLGDVDYYIPTPAVVKSARLAPWSDLVYFVEPGNDLRKTLEKTDKKLELFLNNNKEKICEFLFDYVEKNYNKMINKSHDRLINYLKFLKAYSQIDITKYYFDDKILDEIFLIDITKSSGKYLSLLESKKISKENNIFIDKSKKLFYDLGFIWRGNNFFKFRTQIENMLIYSKSKIEGIKVILDKEKQNLGKNLKCAIITDYLEDRDGIINCKYILKELKGYKDLNPVLVSGQGIYRLTKIGKLEKIDTNILEVTRWVESGKINLVIGTRGILGEGWDCSSLNTLIDLTGIVAYMSVNQVRGRAIRLDKTNLNKVANIYDIVTYYEGYTKEVDLYRLERKHEKFYGVDDTGLIIRGVDHIYPNIRKYIGNYKKINENMLKRSEMRAYYFKLWGIGGKYENKEIFGLDLGLSDIGKIIPFVNFRGYDSILFFKMLGNKNKLKDLNKNNFYFELIKRFLNDFITNIVKTQIKLKILDNKFKFTLLLGNNGNFKLISDFKDELMVKRFIVDISTIFTTVIDQKYILKYPFAYYNGIDIKKYYLNLPLPKTLSSNKKIRNLFISEIENDFLSNKLLLDGMLFLYLPHLFSKRLRLMRIYKKIFFIFIRGRNTFYFINIYDGLINFDFNLMYLYLNSESINKSEYIGKKSFIEAKVEKIWI